jgi:hypothetical protein
VHSLVWSRIVQPVSRVWVYRILIDTYSEYRTLAARLPRHGVALTSRPCRHTYSSLLHWHGRLVRDGITGAAAGQNQAFTDRIATVPMELAAQVTAESNKHGRVPEGLSGAVVATNEVTSARMARVPVEGDEMIKQETTKRWPTSQRWPPPKRKFSRWLLYGDSMLISFVLHRETNVLEILLYVQRVSNLAATRHLVELSGFTRHALPCSGDCATP